MNNKTILCVEDNPRVQMFNKPLLESKGFTVRLAMTLAEAREAVEREAPDLIILDIRLPDGSGLDFLRELRKSSAVPVIALTNDGAERDIVAGLAGGCDDYISKPYAFPVLYARVEALLRRAARVPQTVICGRLSLDTAANAASIDGQDLLLTPKEFALLLLFIQNEGRFMRAEYLYDRVWKRPMAGDSQAVRKTVSKLRDKIAGSGRSVIWLRGEGWCFGKE